MAWDGPFIQSVQVAWLRVLLLVLLVPVAVVVAMVGVSVAVSAAASRIIAESLISHHASILCCPPPF